MNVISRAVGTERAGDPPAIGPLIRAATVGQLLPSRAVRTGRARRIDAVAFVLPGRADLGGYAGELRDRTDDFAAWDGRVVVLEPDGQPEHRVAIVDRYGQVYETTEAPDASSLPDADAIEEWFKFLATACPECGVIDDPRPRDWVP
jgi:hypothetical protein